MSMSQYATYADYHASLNNKSPIDKDATLTRIQAMAAEAEAEAQKAKDADNWRKLVAMGIADAEEAIACGHTMADFVKRITEQ